MRLAGVVKNAMEEGDLTAYADILDPGVRWGSPGDPSPPCQTREQVLAWYGRGRKAGIRARVTETQVCGDRILVGLKVAGGQTPVAGEEDRWQVLTVQRGRVTRISGFGDRDEAAAEAGLAAALARRPATVRWAIPQCPLSDDQVVLRMPEPRDAVALRAYAAEPGGLDGVWAPLADGASLVECQALVDDWLAGWRGQRSLQGPALVIGAGGPVLVGQVGLGDRGDGAIELGYGIAPGHRGRGYATRAVRLITRWLLDDGLADSVELRIDQGNAASQRVAAAAGFELAGTVRSHVPMTGETFTDLRFVMSQ